MKQATTRLIDGLSKDFEPIDHPMESPSFILNGIRDNHKGGRFRYQSEPGNKALSYTLKEGYNPVGSIYGKDSELIIFSTNEVDSEIGLLKKDIYTVIVNDEDQEDKLGFSTKYLITGQYRVKNDCFRIIYWCDGYNPDRQLNLDDLEEYQTSLGEWDINKFKLNPTVNLVDISISKINNTGGNLKLGMYSAQAEVLDSDLNVIHVSDISRPIYIYDESVNYAYKDIDGGYNLSDFPESIGGVDSTNKSFNITVSNIDTSFQYIRFNIIYSSSGDGFTKLATQVGDLIPITSNTINYTYTGINYSRGDIDIDYQQTLQGVTNYESSEYLLQIQNRLVRFNIDEPKIDFSAYQQAANNITVNYVKKVLQFEDQSQLGDPKNGLTLASSGHYMPNEVYALGIVFIIDNYYKSPALHIPGRAKDSSDTTLYEVVASNATGLQVDIADVRHLGVSVGDQVPKWKFRNTAFVGKMGFWEADNSVYPTNKDCDGNYIYGNLAGKPIRHHRMPDRFVEPIYQIDDGGIVAFGLEFSNIVYPDDRITGHYFVVGKRDEQNRLVLDRGVSSTVASYAQDFNNIPDSIDQALLIEGHLDSQAPDQIQDPDFNYDHVTFLSPGGLLCDRYESPDYIKFENTFSGVFPSVDFQYVNDSNLDLYTFTKIIDFKANFDADTTETLNRTVIGNAVVPVKSVLAPSQGFDIALFNGSSANDVHVFRTADDVLFDDVPQINYISLEVIKDIYPNLFNINYYKMHDDVRTLSDSQVVYGGDCYINCVNYTNYSYEKNSPLQQGPTVFGDHFIGLLIDSDVNYAMRHEGTDRGNSYFKGDTTEELRDYLLTKVAYINPNDLNDTDLLEIAVKEFYGYNKDYNVKFYDTSFITLPITYDYCNECLNQYTNRIAFSPQSFSEEISDTYRINFLDDYIDTPSHKGGIVGARYKNNKLYVHTPQATFIYQPNPQFVNTDQNTAYLNTGDFLSIPPNELLETTVGYAGAQFKQSFISTQYGDVWIDSNRGHIFLLSGEGLNEITKKGMSFWFQENLPIRWLEQYGLISGAIWPYINTTGKNGVGVSCAYDPYYKRLIIHKRDYIPLLPFTRIKGSNGIYYDVDENKFYIGDQQLQTTVVTDITNPKYFRNNSWTISYSFDYDSWTSWHSYLPNFMMYNENKFYSMLYNNNNIWEHLNKGNYQTYYGTKNDFIVEYIIKDYMTSNIQSIHYIGETKEWDETNQSWKDVDKTFDRMLCYNSRQSTGLQNLLLLDQHQSPYSNLFYDNIVKNVIKTDRNYKISGLYDISTNHPVITSNWNNVSNDYFIDLVSLDSNINYNAQFYDYADFSDKYLVTRLYFKPSNDYRKVIQLISNNVLDSYR